MDNDAMTLPESRRTHILISEPDFRTKVERRVSSVNKIYGGSKNEINSRYSPTSLTDC